MVKGFLGKVKLIQMRKVSFWEIIRVLEIISENSPGSE